MEFPKFVCGIVHYMSPMSRQHAIESNEAQRLPFDPHKMAERKYPLVGYQNIYFYPDSFEEALWKVRYINYSSFVVCCLSDYCCVRDGV